MPTVELNTEYTNAHRFPAWMTLGIFSAICLAAVNSKVEADERDGNEKWVLACTILSMLVGLAGFAGYLVARSLFVGQAPEMGLVRTNMMMDRTLWRTSNTHIHTSAVHTQTVAAIALWAAGLPVIMDPDNGIAVRNITVLNANLYFFSWLALGSVVFISGSLAQEQLGVNVMEIPPHAVRWYGLSASSLVVLGAAVRVFLAVPCNDTIDAIESGAFCKRTRLAISLGVLSTVAGFGMTYATTTKRLSIAAETAVTAVLLVMWCFGVGYTTFGESPGSQIGNLYFSSWISFLLSVFLFGHNFREFVSARSAPVEDSTSSDPSAMSNGGSDLDLVESHSSNIPEEDDI